MASKAQIAEAAALQPFVESVIAASGASRAAVLDALTSMTDEVGKRVRALLHEQAIAKTVTAKAKPRIALSRIVAGAKSLDDLRAAKLVSHDVIGELSKDERKLYHELTAYCRVRPGRALAATLKQYRAKEYAAQ